MRVVTADLASAAATGRRLRTLNFELLGLTATSIVVVLGLVLTCAAKIGALAVPGGEVIPLYGLRTAADLEPALSIFGSTYERQFAARVMFQRVSASKGRLDRIGNLSDVRVPATVVRKDSRLTELRARLAARQSADDVPLLTRQDIVSMKPRLAVRSQGEFTRRMVAAAAAFVAAFWFAHLFRRWRRRSDDPLL